MRIKKNRRVVPAVADVPQCIGSIMDLLINSYAIFRFRFNLSYLSLNEMNIDYD
jgi:hypothetical protein